MDDVFVQTTSACGRRPHADDMCGRLAATQARTALHTAYRLTCYRTSLSSGYKKLDRSPGNMNSVRSMRIDNQGVCVCTTKDAEPMYFVK